MVEISFERHPAVVEPDLPEIYAFFARDDKAAAERVLVAVEAGFSQLTHHPESGVASSRPQLVGSGERAAWVWCAPRLCERSLSGVHAAGASGSPDRIADNHCCD